MTKFLFACALTILLPFATLASGTMELEGKVRSFSADTVEINDGHQIYSIEKKRLGLNDQAKLKNLKFGSVVKLMVPFDAVSAVKPIK